MERSYKECKSCNLKDNCFVMVSFHLRIQCPCSDCLVKPMCKNRCEDRDIIWQKAEKEHKVKFARS